MKLLHVVHSLSPGTGGVASAVQEFVQVAGESSTQSVLTLDHASDPWIRDFPGQVHCVGPGRGRYGFSRQLPAWLKERVKEYDALLLHGCWQFHSLAASAAARAANIPYFVFPHGMLDPYFNRVSRLKRLKKLAYWPFERNILNNARALLFTSEIERERALAAFKLRGTGRIVPLGIEAKPGTPADEELFLEHFPKLRNRRVVLFLGRLHPKKGVDLLIRAFGSLLHRSEDFDWRLVLAGPPASENYGAELQSLARASCPPETVLFPGMLTGRLKAGALAIADVFALPSHQENFGVSVVEALANGLPVLITDQVNIWREICADKAGFMAPDTEAGMRDLLKHWFQLSHSDVAELRRAAFESYNSRYRAEIASDNFIRTLRQCGVRSNESRIIDLRTVPA